MFLGFGKKSNYEVHPKTSINSLPLNKVTRILLKYITYRFLRNLKLLLPKKIKIILKNIFKLN